ncbi:MAG: hypothetical protein ACLT9P_07735 [Evtepia gabavorous]
MIDNLVWERKSDPRAFSVTIRPWRGDWEITHSGGLLARRRQGNMTMAGPRRPPTCGGGGRRERGSCWAPREETWVRCWQANGGRQARPRAPTALASAAGAPWGAGSRGTGLYPAFPTDAQPLRGP